MKTRILAVLMLVLVFGLVVSGCAQSTTPTQTTDQTAQTGEVSESDVANTVDAQIVSENAAEVDVGEVI